MNLPESDGEVTIRHEHQARFLPLLRLLVLALCIGEIASLRTTSVEVAHQTHEDVALGDLAPAEV